MRRDDLYLVDIVEACDAVERFTAGHDQASLASDDLVGSAVLQKISVLGEAAARLSPSLREQYPQIAWRQAARARNLVVHAYFTVDWDVIWRIVERDLPRLRDGSLAVLREGWPSTAEELQQRRWR